MLTRSFGVVLGLIAAFPGCDKVRSVVCEPVVAAAPQPGAAAGAGAPKPLAAAGGGAAPAHDVAQEAEHPAPQDPSEPQEAAKRKPDLLTSSARFALPFAWEKSPTEPLARAKIFLRELADDNVQYMTKGPEFFKAFAAAETPRSTVVTCADARVQSPAFDATPENDDFTVRNIGNQLDSTLGSVQYGVEHLNTPVLLIMGHTGCGAVKAALGETRELPSALRRELSGLHLKKGKGPLDDKRWADAVLENVHDQVGAALKQFGARVNTGELTIIGAVYDFRNDLGKGPGRLTVIDVNGVQDEARLKAFGDAIMATPNPHAPAKKENSLDRLARALTDSVVSSVHGGDDEEEEDEEEEAEPATKPGATPGANEAKEAKSGAIPASAAAPHGARAQR
jgi:carbonic anhydrase